MFAFSSQEQKPRKNSVDQILISIGFLNSHTVHKQFILFRFIGFVIKSVGFCHLPNVDTYGHNLCFARHCLQMSSIKWF